MRKFIATSAIAGIAFVIGAFTQFCIQTPLQPNCPTEDSCAINYQNGEWVITPQIP